MHTKFNLIQEAQDDLEQKHHVLSLLEGIALVSDLTSVKEVCESVDQVLAHIASNKQSMHPRSIAAFLAGVDHIIHALPNAEPKSKQNTLRVLTNAALKFDDLTKQSLPNQAVVNIARIGSQFNDLVTKYLQIVNADPKTLDSIAKKLSYRLQQTVNIQQSGNMGQLNPAPKFSV